MKGFLLFLLQNLRNRESTGRIGVSIMASIIDVANLAGVGLGTASRALSG